MNRFILFVGVVGVAACGVQAASDSAGEGGGGVSFGGAQDMGQFRATLERGEIPEADSLDANGFFNEHFNAIPEAGCGGELCLTPGISIARDWLTGQHQATLQIAVSTPRDPAEFPRLPMNLVVVVDKSGSMASDDRLTKVKTGLHALVDNLEEGDRIAIVSFSDAVTINAPFGEEVDVPALHTAIDDLRPYGGTNIFEGLRTGFSLLGEYSAATTQNRVIFLSDGLATVGVTDQSSIMSMARENIGTGVGLTTIGVGNDFDVALMRGLAENGAGNYYYLEDGAAAAEVFTEELAYFMTPIALDITIEANTASGWRMLEVVGSQLWSAGSQFGSLSIPAAFVASRTEQQPGEGRRGGGSMIFVALDPTTAAGAQIADLRLSYRIPGSTERFSQEVALDYAADPRETPVDAYLSGAEMAERFAMYNLFLGFRAATRSTDPSCAAAALLATRTSAVAWNERYPDPDIAADLVLLEQYLANLRAVGATTDRDLASCPSTDPDGYPYGDDVHYHQGYGCASTTPSASWLLLVGILGFVVRRRKC